jgi:hypothetical protein
MAAAPPYLPTLPRELRDKIYSYLSYEVVVECGWEPVTWGVGKCKARRVVWENAPIVSVLLMHSRLHDEYLESDAFKSSTINFTIDPRVKKYITKEQNALNEGPSIRKALHTIRNATVKFTQESACMAPLWYDLLSTIYSLYRIAPQLSTIKIAVQE